LEAGCCDGLFIRVKDKCVVFGHIKPDNICTLGGCHQNKKPHSESMGLEVGVGTTGLFATGS